MPSSASARGGAISIFGLETVDAASTWRSAALVEPDLGLAFAALDVEVDGEVAARDALGHGLADARLERFVAGRQAQPHVEAAAVDRAHLPVPGDRPRRAVGAGKAGHALDGHVSASWPAAPMAAATCVSLRSPEL